MAPLALWFCYGEIGKLSLLPLLIRSTDTLTSTGIFACLYKSTGRYWCHPDVSVGVGHTLKFYGKVMWWTRGCQVSYPVHRQFLLSVTFCNLCKCSETLQPYLQWCHQWIFQWIFIKLKFTNIQTGQTLISASCKRFNGLSKFYILTK